MPHDSGDPSARLSYLVGVVPYYCSSFSPYPDLALFYRSGKKPSSSDIQLFVR